MSDTCPRCGSDSYSTSQEKERIDEGLVTFSFASECSNCGYYPHD